MTKTVWISIATLLWVVGICSYDVYIFKKITRQIIDIEENRIEIAVLDGLTSAYTSKTNNQ